MLDEKDGKSGKGHGNAALPDGMKAEQLSMLSRGDGHGLRLPPLRLSRASLHLGPHSPSPSAGLPLSWPPREYAEHTRVVSDNCVISVRRLLRYVGHARQLQSVLQPSDVKRF